MAYERGINNKRNNLTPHNEKLCYFQFLSLLSPLVAFVRKGIRQYFS